MRKKIAYLLLMTVLALQLQVPVFAAGAHNLQKANLEVTLNLNSHMASIPNNPLMINLLQNGQVIRSMPLKDQNENSYKVLFDQLLLGNYQVKLEAPGYKTYESESIPLETHEKHLVVSAGHETFAAGDINQDNKIDAGDISLLELQLGEITSNPSFDLNRDGQIDIEDLSQLYWNQEISGSTSLYNTRIIMSQMADTLQMTEDFVLDNGGRAEITNGSISDLLSNSTNTSLVLKNTIGAITPDNPIKFPISFKEEVNVSQIRLTSTGEGLVTQGNLLYEENGETIRVPFVTNDVPTQRSFFRSVRNKSNTVTINLGAQVPIQKITVEVTGTENGNHLASISKIEFLENVLDDSINQEQSIIKAFKGSSKHESVELTWNKLPNVAGYKIQYGTTSGDYQESTYASSNTALITGLKNFTPYYFVVQAINGDWEGPVSEEIMVEPKPQNKPSSPQNIQVESLDSGLTVSWRNDDNTQGSHLYYKKKDTPEYTKIHNISGSSQSIIGLENGQTYNIYVTAYNEVGESSPSEIVEATPIEDVLKIPNVPTHQEIGKEHITKIELRDPSNVDMAFYPTGFSTSNMIDKDYRTHWTALTYQRNRGIKVTFDQPYEMDYMAFVSRLDRDLKGGNRWYKSYPYSYGIRIWESPTAVPKEIVAANKGVSIIPSSGEEGLFILPFPKSTVYQIEIILYEWDGAGNISISEAMFYEYYDLVSRIDALFNNGTYTQLASGVTLAHIQSLEDELNNLEGARLQVSETILKEEIQLAKDLATTGTSVLIEDIVTVNQTRNPATEGDRQFANGRGLSALQPTGVMAHADEQIVVYVDTPNGGDLPTLVFSQFYGDGTWNKRIALQPGRNVITVPRIVNYNAPKGGPIYIEYTGTPQSETKIHIRKATSIPTLEILDLEDSTNIVIHKQKIQRYIEELIAHVATLPTTNMTKNPLNSTEIGTSKVLLSIPATGVLESIQSGLSNDLDAQVERLYESLLTWEANLELHYEILGLTKDAIDTKHRWPDTRINIRYMPMNPGVFMYAAADHVGIGYGSEKGLVNGYRSNPNGYFGWGINHEIGHILNTNEYIYGEITNNIFSLFSQTINGGESRLEKDDTYKKIYSKVVSSDTGLSSNVFVTLGMFWQLHLAYDDFNDFEGIDAFYPRLNRLFREDATQGIDKHNMLVRLASDVVQKDLTPFFEQWNLPISVETKHYTSKYPTETSAIYYLNDDAKRYRENNGVAIDFTLLNLNAQSSLVPDTLSEDEEVLITINHDQEPIDSAGISSILGYEIYRNGELITFTTEPSYTDTLPEGNNLVYNYEIIAYDKLLNTSSKTTAGSIYIAKDGILDKSNFITDRTTSGALIIDMQSPQEVIGIKLSDISTITPPSITTPSTYHIQVSENGIDWTTAKSCNLTLGDNLLYFNKPGTDEYDQRIWTYDARYIRIDGVSITSIQPNQIDVLAYPGDAVYFTEGAIGKLGHDYYYNGGVITEGSLVVLGTYRGHPIYSKIILSAKYTNDKDYDSSERPNYDNETFEEAINGELFLFAELPTDNQVSKVNNGIWLFAPTEQTLPSEIKANMYRTDDASSIVGGRLVSDTIWLSVPDLDSLPTIILN